MTFEESWNNSLNKYLAIMDTRTDYIPAIVEEIIEEVPNNEIRIIRPSTESSTEHS